MCCFERANIPSSQSAVTVGNVPVTLEVADPYMGALPTSSINQSERGCVSAMVPSILMHILQILVVVLCVWGAVS